MKKTQNRPPVSYGDSTWGDLLTSYKGHSISYDEIGNPENLYVNGHDYVMTWTAGRRLAAMTNSAGNEYYTFTYNDEGIRTSKTAYGTTHNYLLSGSQIIAEDLGNILLVYLYDENGSPMGMQYRTSSMNEGVFYTFWFEKNLHGDIIAVYNESGTKLITYTYDAWGNVTQTVHNHAGSNSYAGYNPFRYRGYYYDTETKLYYLQSRYYSPEMGRFINADGYVNANGDIIGFNMFAYCGNNPIMFTDPTGEFFVSTTLICVIAGALIVGTIGGVIGNAYADSQGYTGWDKTECIIIGASVGAVAGGVAGYIAAPAVTAITGIAGVSVTSAGITAVGTGGAVAVEQVTEKAITALQPYYPPNDGFSGVVQKITLEAGTLIQRTGELYGRFVAPAGTPTQMLSLPYDKIGQTTTYLQLQQSIEVLAGKVAPWFGQPGGGIQYILETPLDQLIKEGVITIFGG